MSKSSPKPKLSDDEIRRIMLQYFYDRNQKATSLWGKSGSGVTISVVRKDLKSSHGFTVQEVVSNLRYLISQDWIEEKQLLKAFTTPKGSTVPSPKTLYVITAAGIDKIAGSSEFTRDRFEGIKIEATGQNIITLGDGNRVDVRFQRVAEALSDLREAVRSSNAIDDATKMNLIVDIDTIETQLAKAQPNRTVVQTLWEGIARVAALASLADIASRTGQEILKLLS